MPSACASEPARSIGGTSMATSPQRALPDGAGDWLRGHPRQRRAQESCLHRGLREKRTKRVLANRYHTPHHLHGLRPAHHNRHKPTTATSRLRRPLVRTGIQPSLSEVLGLVDVDARPHLGEGCERGAAAQIKLLQ